jgi:hypothetical protein
VPLDGGDRPVRCFPVGNHDSGLAGVGQEPSPEPRIGKAARGVARILARMAWAYRFLEW